MNARYLIVSADDFGLCESVNSAIAELFRENAVTSAGILAPARCARDACAWAAANSIPVGAHWTLHAEWAEEPWKPSAGEEGARTLTEGGYLMADARAVAKQAKAADVTRELAAQYEFLRANGCAPDHADSHGGTLYGTNGRLFFLNAFRVCRRYGLPFRFAKSPAFIARQMNGALPAPLRAAHRAIVAAAGMMGVDLLDDFVTNPLPFEKLGGYEAMCAYYEAELKKSGPGVTEVFLHPALPDPAMEARTPQWQKRVWEYEYLGSGRLARFAKTEGFSLTSFGNAPFPGQKRGKA